MSYFRTQLVASKVSDADDFGRALWCLRENLEFYSDSRGLVTVPAGFITDFASVPRAPFAYWLAGDTAHASAAVHDYLVRGDYAEGLIDWAGAAFVFREAMCAEGVPPWRRWIMYWAVMQADPSHTWSAEA